MGNNFDLSHFLAAASFWAVVTALLAVVVGWLARRSAEEGWLRGSAWSVALAAATAATVTVSAAFVAGAPGAMLEDDLTVVPGQPHPLVAVSWYLFAAGLQPISESVRVKPVLPVVEGWLCWFAVGGATAGVQCRWWRR